VTAALLLALAVSIALPLLSAWRLARLDAPSRRRWLLEAADAVALAAVVLLVARWDIAGLHTRTVLIALIAGAGLWSLARHAGRPWRTAVAWRRADRWTTLASLGFLAALGGVVVAGALPRPGAQALGCPLAGGRFVVGQGGGNRLLNHHAGHPAQRYAADILALWPGGFRATGLLPRELERYAAFGAEVVSPCPGRVVAAEDGLPDLVPPRSDPEHPAGNHLVLACGDLHVELAHLAMGSLAVTPGQEVAVGTRLATVGNSGNTTEPHLHVHAVDAATGHAVPITLAGTTPVRNRVLDC
jgi:hypothetical protein